MPRRRRERNEKLNFERLENSTISKNMSNISVYVVERTGSQTQIHLRPEIKILAHSKELSDWIIVNSTEGVVEVCPGGCRKGCQKVPHVE